MFHHFFQPSKLQGLFGDRPARASASLFGDDDDDDEVGDGLGSEGCSVGLETCQCTTSECCSLAAGGVFGKAKKDSVTEEDCITQSKAIFQGHFWQCLDTDS